MHTNSSDVSHRNSPDFSIYVTHGGAHGKSLVMKGLARNLSKNNPYLKDKPYILAAYADGFFSLSNRADLASHLGCDLEQIPVKCTEEVFINFIHWIKQQCFIDRPCVMLCMDPNLGVIAGQKISELFLVLVKKIDPKFLFACSGTPECIAEVNKYLAGEAVVIETKESEQEYRLPLGVISGASDKDEITALIKSSLKHHNMLAELLQMDASYVDVSTNPTTRRIRNLEEVLNSNACDLRGECSSQVAQYDLQVAQYDLQVAQYDLINDLDNEDRNNSVRTYQNYFTSCLTCLSFFRTRAIAPESPSNLTTRNTEPSTTNRVR